MAALASTASTSGPRREEHLAAGEHVAGDDVQRDRKVFEALVQDVARDETAQRAARGEVPLGAEEPEQARQRLEREDLAPAHAQP